jgi:hypothetical protein
VRTSKGICCFGSSSMRRHANSPSSRVDYINSDLFSGSSGLFEAPSKLTIAQYSRLPTITTWWSLVAQTRRSRSGSWITLQACFVCSSQLSWTITGSRGTFQPTNSDVRQKISALCRFGYLTIFSRLIQFTCIFLPF